MTRSDSIRQEIPELVVNDTGFGSRQSPEPRAGLSLGQLLIVKRSCNNRRRELGTTRDGEEYPDVKARIEAAATEAGRKPEDIGTEAGVAVVGPRKDQWQERVSNWHKTGLTHLCLRTLGGGLAVDGHIPTMRAAVAELPI